MTSGSEGAVALTRVPSGIGGLDTVLKGGYFEGGITIVQGQPGAGKTIFGNQLCFHHVQAGGRALYVTLLAETHERMLMHLGSLSFFDMAVIPERLSYISTFPVLEAEGLAGLVTVLRREIRARGATLLVLDGLVAAEQRAGSDMEFKKFIHELQGQAAIAGCSMFLLTSSGTEAELATAAHTMVDCVITLKNRLFGWRSERALEVVKRRGDSYLRGQHAFRITERGLVVHPRFESWRAVPETRRVSVSGTVSSGLPMLDSMFGGGIPRASMTLAIGTSGAGKTTLGLHFLSKCHGSERGVLFTTYESPDAVLAKAEALALPVAQAIKDGHVIVIWQPSTDGLLDEACEWINRTVRDTKAQRLVLDGIGGLSLLAPEPDRMRHVFAALMHELRAQGVNTLCTSEHEETGAASGPALAGHSDLSSITENTLVMRLVEHEGDLLRFISVLKARDTPIDSRLRRFTIGAAGIDIATLPKGPARPPDGQNAGS